MKKKTTLFLLLLPFLLVTALVLTAVWNVFLQSVGYIPAFQLTKPTLQYYIQVFTRQDFLSALWVSLRLSLFSSVLAVVLGVAISMALIRCRKNRGGMVYAIRIPILVPHAVVALFIIQLRSQTGLFARLCHGLGLLQESSEFPQLLFTPGYWGTILAYVWKEAPFVAYFVLAFMGAISETLGEAAENLGASPLRAFREITLPMSLGVISKAFLIIFIFAFGGYELPLLLGSTLPKALAVQTYLAYTSPDLLQRPLAMAMNGVVLILSALMAFAFASATYRLEQKTGGKA